MMVCVFYMFERVKCLFFPGEFCFFCLPYLLNYCSAEGDGSGAEWYVDHVSEELDFPREFFFEAASQVS